MISNEGLLEEFRATCTRAGVKVTHQRFVVFQEVTASSEHPDAETIYRRVRRKLPTISLDTVYRTLCLLEKLGLLTRVEALTDRVRFDSNVRKHHHFICTKCGLVRDFVSEEADNLAIPESVLAMGDVNSTHLQFRGTCRACAAEPQET